MEETYNIAGHGRYFTSWGFIDLGSGMFGGYGGHNYMITLNYNGQTGQTQKIGAYANSIYDLGLTVQLLDESGDMVTLVVTRPDGSVISPVPVIDSTAIIDTRTVQGQLIPTATKTVIAKITGTQITGYVEKTSGGLIWHLSDGSIIPYGAPDDIPALWSDAGNDSLSVIRADRVFLDKNLSGGIGEIEATTADISIDSQNAGETWHISYPPSPSSLNKIGSAVSKGGIGVIAVILGILAVLFFVFMRKK